MNYTCLLSVIWNGDNGKLVGNLRDIWKSVFCFLTGEDENDHRSENELAGSSEEVPLDPSSLSLHSHSHGGTCLCGRETPGSSVIVPKGSKLT